MVYGHRQVCTDRGGRHVFGFRFGRCSMANIRFGLLTTAVCLGGGLILVRDKDTKVKED